MRNVQKFIPIANAVSSELDSIVQFGGDVEDGGFYARIGDQPFAFRVPQVFEEMKVDINSPLYEQFDVWLVPHRVSIIRRTGQAEVTSVGIEVEYLNRGRTCTVISLFPSFQYVTHGEMNLSLRAGGAISVTGEMQTMPSGIPFPMPSLSKGTLDFGLDSGGGVLFQMKSTVSTPLISAVGKGSTRSEWLLEKGKEPLFGRDIETWSTLVLPCREDQGDEVSYRIRFYLTFRTLFFNTRRESDWTELRCKLLT